MLFRSSETVPRLGGVWVWNGAAWSCAHGAKRHCFSPPPGLSFMPLQIWSKALAISGILTMGLALLGCVGALKEFRCLLGLVSAPPPSIPRLIHILPSNRALADTTTILALDKKHSWKGGLDGVKSPPNMEPESVELERETTIPLCFSSNMSASCNFIVKQTRVLDRKSVV